MIAGIAAHIDPIGRDASTQQAATGNDIAISAHGQRQATARKTAGCGSPGKAPSLLPQSGHPLLPPWRIGLRQTSDTCCPSFQNAHESINRQIKYRDTSY